MNSVTVVQQIATDQALCEANAGRTPDEQVRDPRRLGRTVCAWCGRLIRYAIWQQEDGLAENTSHGICPACMASLKLAHKTLDIAHGIVYNGCVDEERSRREEHYDGRLLQRGDHEGRGVRDG